MSVLERLTGEDFEPLVGQAFELEAPGSEPFEAVLSNCERSAPAAPDGVRAPFSLLLHAAPERLVAQQICKLRHPELGELELFVVPLGPDERGMRYQIVFG